MKNLILKAIPNSFSRRITLLILLLALLTMCANITVTIFFEYSNAYKTAQKSIESQFSIMAKDLAEAIITDDIYALYTMVEEVSKNIDHIYNIIVFDGTKHYITDAKVRKDEPADSGNYVVIEKSLNAGLYRTVGYVEFYISRSSILKSIMLNVRYLIMVNLVILIFGAAVGMFAGRKLTRPMLSLSEQISKLDVLRLPYHISLPVYSSRETQALKDVIEELSADLKDSLDKITQQQKDIARSERLAYAGTMSAGLAHELKNPIMSISLILESMAADYVNDKQFQEDYRIIKAQSDKLVYRINEFLSYSKPVSLTMRETGLYDMISELKRHTYSLQISGLDVKIDASEDSALLIDTEKLIQIFEILFNNSKDAGADNVSVFFSEEDGMLKMNYKDNGTGFSEDDLPKIMLPFYSTKKHGTGLGLAICSTIIDAMGGSIDAWNNEGGGASFRIKVPVAPQQP